MTLLARLEAAEAGSYELDLAIAQWCYDGAARDLVNYDPELWLQRNGGFTDSIDAAKALIERVLPGACRLMMVHQPDGSWEVGTLWTDEAPDAETHYGASPTLPLAMCIALIRAKEAKGE